MFNNTCVALVNAFREVTQSLIGLLGIYDADPRLAEDMAGVLRRIFHTHIDRNESNSNATENEDLRDLLEELETMKEEIQIGH